MICPGSPTQTAWCSCSSLLREDWCSGHRVRMGTRVLLLLACAVATGPVLVSAAEFKGLEAKDGGDEAAQQIIEMHKIKAHGGELFGSSRSPPAEGQDFVGSFGASFLMILACEVGDKTFFIAAIMSMRHPQSVVFAGAITALAVMTVMGVGLGWLVPKLIPIVFTHYISIALFVFFGLQLLKEAHEAEAEGFEELEEVEAELGKKEDDPEAQKEGSKSTTTVFMERFASPIFVQAYTMTFVAEWGDRSQIATIALGAQKEPFGVVFGGIAGHCICTGVAVLGGKLISTYTSERTVAFVGGVVFLGFGIVTAILGPSEHAPLPSKH